MAKKVASGTSALVLDLKVGRGAFAADLEQAKEIGRLCRLIGAAYGRPTTCLYTAMDAPLGRTVGNRLEVEEAWQVLERRRAERRARGRRSSSPARTAAAVRPGVDGAEARRARGGGARRRPRRRALRALVLRAGRPLAAGRVPPAGRARGQGARGRVRRPPSTRWPSAAPPSSREPAAARWTTPSTRPPASCSSGRLGDAVEAGESAGGRVLARSGAAPRGEQRARDRVHRGPGRAAGRARIVLGREDAAARRLMEAAP